MNMASGGWKGAKELGYPLKRQLRSCQKSCIHMVDGASHVVWWFHETFPQSPEDRLFCAFSHVLWIPR